MILQLLEIKRSANDDPKILGILPDYSKNDLSDFFRLKIENNWVTPTFSLYLDKKDKIQAERLKKEDWLQHHCQSRVYFHYGKKYESYFFESDDELMLFKMVWQ